MKRVLVVFGTRPEAIKMAALVKQLSQQSELDFRVCCTAQHREMLDQVLDLFDIKPDFDLDLMSNGQDLTDITSKILLSLRGVFAQYLPDIVLVHGDTTTTLAASLAAFYHRIPVGHVEAGLRTGDMLSPWPEEGNRVLTGRIADFHFAPTDLARANLLNENIAPENILVTGNTVIDALLMTVRKLEIQKFDVRSIAGLQQLDVNRKLILVTCHRRESFGGGIDNVCNALRQIAKDFPDIQIVYPVHLNPNIRGPAFKLLDGIEDVFLLEPQKYLPFVALMRAAHIILTDSGGIQEEAPALSKPVLVMRQVSERQEAIEAGTVKLVGTEAQDIVTEVSELLSSEDRYQTMAETKNPYGNGTASQQIIDFLRKNL